MGNLDLATINLSTEANSAVTQIHSDTHLFTQNNGEGSANSSDRSDTAPVSIAEILSSPRSAQYKHLSDENLDLFKDVDLFGYKIIDKLPPEQKVYHTKARTLQYIVVLILYWIIFRLSI